MPPTSSSPSLRSLSLSLSFALQRAWKLCRNKSSIPPMHHLHWDALCPAPLNVVLSFLSSHLSTPLWKPLALLSQKGWWPWIRSLQNRCSNTKLLEHKRALYTLSPNGDCPDVDVGREKNCRGKVCSVKWFLVHSAWASIRNEEWASVSPLSFMNHQMLYLMNMDLALFFFGKVKLLQS